MRAIYGEQPANQFNADLCLDFISVLKRTRKDYCQATPYELFTGDSIDYMKDFRCLWGELVVVKKPKIVTCDRRMGYDSQEIYEQDRSH